MFWVFAAEDLEAMQRARSAFDPDGRHESRKDLSGRRRVRVDPHRTHQARARGGHVDLTRYAFDGMAPSSVESPATARGRRPRPRAMRIERRGAVVVHGGGTRIGIGDPPSRYDTAVDLRGLRGRRRTLRADLVCIVRAGTTLAELAAALAPRDSAGRSMRRSRSAPPSVAPSRAPRPRRRACVISIRATGSSAARPCSATAPSSAPADAS